MQDLKHAGSGPSACLIGDLVASRTAIDRSALHRRLGAVLSRVEADVPSRTPLRVIAGDEFQGSYASIGRALAASFRIQLGLWPEVGVRHGIGWGGVRLLDDGRLDGVMDGPGWWSARAAIEEVGRLEARPAFALVRTSVRAADPTPADGGPDLVALEAALQCRDHLLGSLSTRSRSLLAGLADGLTQAEVADREGISASAVSQRVRKDGLAVILAAQAMLEEL